MTALIVWRGASRPLRLLMCLAIAMALSLGSSASPAAATSTLYQLDINVWGCSVDATNLGYSDIAPNCTKQTESGFFFSATYNANGGQLSGEASAGTMTWVAGFGPGDWTLAETFPPSGYDSKRVFCTFYAPDGSTVLANLPLNDTGWSAYLYVAGDANTIVCDWFHFNATPAPTTGTVTVNKQSCPQGFDAYNASIYDIAANCHDVSQAVTFTLTVPNGTGMPVTTPGVAPNLATWTDIPSGEVIISEESMQGYGLPRVFCKNSQISGTEDPEAEVPVTANTIDVELKNGYDQLYCDWINIPIPEPTATPTDTPTDTPTVTPTIPPTSTATFVPPTPTSPATSSVTTTPTPTSTVAALTITKFTCDPSYDPLATPANPESDCDQAADISFALAAHDGQTSNASTDTTGNAKFAQLDPGVYTLTETYPDGVNAAFVWSCSSTVRQIVSPFAPLAVVGPSGTVQLTLLPAEQLSCDWFDVPDREHVALTVAVFECAGQQASSSGCDPADAGIEIDLFANTSSGADATLTTGDDGTVTANVAAGKYEISTEQTACFIEADQFTADGMLDLTSVDSADVKLYFCNQ